MSVLGRFSFFWTFFLWSFFYPNQQKNREPVDTVVPYVYRLSEVRVHVLRSVPVFWSSLDLD